MCPATRRRTVFGGRQENLTNSRAPADRPGGGAGALARPATFPPYRRSQIVANQSAGGASIPSPSPAGRPSIPRSRCLDFRTCYRESQIRRSLRGRPIWERGRSETSILGRPALTPGFKPAFGRNPTRSCRQQLRGTRLRTVIPLPPPREIRTVMPMSRNPNSRISRELSGDAPSLPGPARNRPTFGQTAG